MDEKKYKCKFCHKVFSHGKSRNRHEKVCIFFIIFIRVNVLREFFSPLYIFFSFSIDYISVSFKPYIKIYIISFTVHIGKNTTVMCVEHHLEEKMYSQNTKRLTKIENKKKAVIHHYHFLPKSKE